jgi:hypothetical protein
MEQKNIYAKGLYFNKLKPETPDSVKKWKKGGLSIHIDNFVEQLKALKQYENDKGYIKFDLTENEKDGEKFLSFKLNTWTPEDKVESAPEIKEDDIPFF